LDGPANDWQEGPGLVESIWGYRWLVAVAVLVGGLATYAWSSRQPVRYESVVRVFPDTGGDDTGRVVRREAEFLTSLAVLDRAAALTDHRLTAKELNSRLTVEPASDSDVITVKVLEATPQGAAELANNVLSAYREVLIEAKTSGARQRRKTLQARQRRLNDEIVELDQQLRLQPGSQLLKSNRDAKVRQLDGLADAIEKTRDDSLDGSSNEIARESANVPDEPAQPKPKRTAAIGALLAFFAAAGLAWWLSGRRPALERPRFPGRAAAPGVEKARMEPGALLRLPSRFRDGRAASANGAPVTATGVSSGIADFDQIAASVQELFPFLDGPVQRMYEEDLPQLVAEEIAHRFQVDLAAILLDNAGEVQTMGSVGLRMGRTRSTDRGVRHLIEAAARSGPRLVDPDELVRLASTGLGGDQADSLALVPLVRDEVGFGVLVAGRRHTDERVAPLSERDVQEIADCIRDIVPYLWAWLLLRVLKLRLRTLQ
jgi:hypothetical protein